MFFPWASMCDSTRPLIAAAPSTNLPLGEVAWKTWTGQKITRRKIHQQEEMKQKKTMPLVSSQNPSCREHKKDKHREAERAGWRILYLRGPEAYDDGRAQHGAHRVLLPLLHRTIEEESHFPTEKERRSYSQKWILLYRTQLRKCC